jgi:hypothetical protein
MIETKTIAMLMIAIATLGVTTSTISNAIPVHAQGPPQGGGCIHTHAPFPHNGTGQINSDFVCSGFGQLPPNNAHGSPP